MNLSRFLLLLAVAALSGCATSQHESPPPPNQRLTAPAPEGTSRVIIYNSSTAIFASIGHPDRIHIMIDGRILGTLGHGEYVQVFLTPGRHDIALTRREMVSYETEHPVLIDRPTRWLNIHSDAGGTLLDAHDEPPAEFGKKYRAALAQ